MVQKWEIPWKFSKVVSQIAFAVDETRLFWENEMHHVDQHENTHQKSPGKLAKVKKVKKWRTLLYMSGLTRRHGRGRVSGSNRSCIHHFARRIDTFSFQFGTLQLICHPHISLETGRSSSSSAHLNDVMHHSSTWVIFIWSIWYDI